MSGAPLVPRDQNKKNWLLAKRNFKSTIGQLVTPVIIVILLVAFQSLSDYVLSQSGAFPLHHRERRVHRPIARYPVKPPLYFRVEEVW